MTEQKLTTCFWFDRQAEEAAEFYTSLFDDGKITGVTRYGKDAPLPEGTALVVEFTIGGTKFSALNGGPHFKLSEAASIVVPCDTQEEIDRLWEKLVEGGGTHQQCGWLKDRYGMPWQIVPANFLEILRSASPAQAERVMAAVMKMVKIDIAEIEAAYKA